jgi:hypothetical protein
MQRGNVFPTRSDPATHFLAAITTGQSVAEHLPIISAVSAGMHSRSIIRHLVFFSVQNLAWELVFFGRRTLTGASLGEDSFLASYRFTASDGVQYAANAAFVYQATNVDLPYADFDVEDPSIPLADRGGKWHVLLINRSPTAKLANAAGAVRLVGYFEPTYG